MVTPSPDYLELVTRPQPELHRCMLRGQAPRGDDLVGREFRGTNTPATSRLLGIRRFIKGFQRAEDDAITGYNRRVRGADLNAPWDASTWKGQDRFGFFSVTAVDASSRDNHYLNAVLLDYGAGLNPPRDPSAALRDYLVVTTAGLLLGRAFLAIGGRRLPVGYFVLEPL